MIDLHTHSTASDGTLSPSALVRYAAGKNLRAIALTDHDTVEGLPEAIEAGRAVPIEVVPGIEISAEWQTGTMHILGYFINHTDACFREKIAVLQESRAQRNPCIIKKLQHLGLDIQMQEVVAESGSGQVGRPHFAQVLIKKGYVKTPREAFEKYLTKGAKAYVEKYRFNPEDAIALIHKAGGIPVLSHPITLNCNTIAELEQVIKKLTDQGLKGIEAYYPDHDRGMSGICRGIAEKHGLLVTGGSDFHGENFNGIQIGAGKGNLHVPYEVLENLKKAVQVRQSQAH